MISSETVAAIELVKNAYDADATRVLVRFNPPLEIGKGSIEVFDNGQGMSLETIRTAWMEPATPMKRRITRSELRGRRVLGEKGIGRFAASRLANRLEVVTRRFRADEENRVYFDWGKFDDESRYLDEIGIPWEVREPIEIRQGGTIQALWSAEERPKREEQTHGTILRMSELRTNWAASQFETLRVGLSRLISPFFGEELERTDQFLIRLEVPPPHDHLSGIVEQPEALKNPHYLLNGHVDEHGGYDFTLKLRGQRHSEHLKSRFVLEDENIPRCGPFRIELRVWDRDEPSLAELAHEIGSTTADIRRDLDAAAGINVYRDGFRVLPYGDPRNDWLRLDLRRVQNPTLRLSNNQIVGYVLISADSNPDLRDQSNREGLIESPALDDLRNLVTMALAELEKRRYEIRHPRGEKPRKPGGIFARFDLSEVSQMVKQRHPRDRQLLSLIETTQADLGEKIKTVQEVLSRYRRLATLGQLIDTVLHEGRAPLAKIGTEAHLGLLDLSRANSARDKVADRLKSRFETIQKQSETLATVFRKIEPFGGRRRGRPARVRLEQVIADAFAVLEGEISDTGASVQLPQTETRVTVDSAEIQEVIINLLQNSLYWLRRAPKSDRRIVVRVGRKGQDAVQVLFSDSGPGVPAEIRDRIFEPYFSTKPAGVGLGLTIAGEIVGEYYDGDLELVDTGPLPGANFRITLRRRV